MNRRHASRTAAVAALAALALLALPVARPPHIPDPGSAEASPRFSSSLPVARPPHMPDPRLTPGEVLPVTREDTCVPGYAGRARAVSDATKRLVFARYGIAPDSAAYEVDHLVPLTLGGANTVANLFPQPYAGPLGAREKDRLEFRLHALVCAGKITLGEAQRAIRTDWPAAYRKYVPVAAR